MLNLKDFKLLFLLQSNHYAQGLKHRCNVERLYQNLKKKFIKTSFHDLGVDNCFLPRT